MMKQQQIGVMNLKAFLVSQNYVEGLDSTILDPILFFKHVNIIS